MVGVGKLDDRFGDAVTPQKVHTVRDVFEDVLRGFVGREMIVGILDAQRVLVLDEIVRAQRFARVMHVGAHASEERVSADGCRCPLGKVGGGSAVLPGSRRFLFDLLQHGMLEILKVHQSIAADPPHEPADGLDQDESDDAGKHTAHERPEHLGMVGKEHFTGDVDGAVEDEHEDEQTERGEPPRETSRDDHGPPLLALLQEYRAGIGGNEHDHERGDVEPEERGEHGRREEIYGESYAAVEEKRRDEHDPGHGEVVGRQPGQQQKGFGARSENEK